jgi:hypothetical protein
MNWQQKIEAQTATIDRFPNYLPSGLHTSEITALLRQLLDVAVATELLTDSLRVVEERDDRNLSNATKLARQNDALLRLRVALDKLREVE